MTCPSHLSLSLYADDALPADAADAMARHLEACATCRETVAVLVVESRALAHALKSADAGGAIPAFLPRPTIGPVVSWLGWIALAAWAVNLAWSGVAGSVAVPGWLDWILPDASRFGIDALLGVIVQVVRGGGDTLDTLLAPVRSLALLSAGAVVIWLTLGRAALAARARSLVLALALTLLAAAPEGHAFELRRDKSEVIVPASETVDDTLIVSADRILIEGTVTGDLILAGEQVTVRGPVGGSLVVAAEELSLEGDVAGNVFGAAESIDVRGARLGGNVYGVGGKLTLRDDAEITGNAALGVGEGTVQGQIGRDLGIATREASISGMVRGNVRAYAETVNIAGTSRIGGDLYAKVSGEDKLTIGDGAEVAGATVLDTWPKPKNPYLTLEFYLGLGIRVIAALVAGLVVFRVFPTLAGMRIEDGMEVLAAAGVGVVALVATPILALLAVVTLVGAPLGLSALLLYLVALYLAGIVTANQIGRLLLHDEEANAALPLLSGLGIVFVLTNLPFVGGVFRFVAIAFGLGVLLLWLRARWLARG